MSDCTSLSYCKLDTLMVANMELGEAHAEIERLQKRNVELLCALQDIAEDPYAVDYGAAEIARRALEPKP